jgi:hypothetical protein
VISAAFRSTARFVWSKNRVILLACAAVYVAIFIASRIWSPDEVHRSLPQATVVMRLAPFVLPLLILVGSVNVATAQLGSREAYFPRVFYTLPLKAYEMVMPFIVYCVALAAVLWLLGGFISDWLILRLGPPGTPKAVDTISYWLPFLVTSGLVWFQALAWTPVRFGWLRISAFLFAVLAHFVAVLLCVARVVTPNEMIVASLLQIPLAFLVATRGVARDRRGVTHDHASKRVVATDKSEGRIARAAARRPLRRFSGAFEAQHWFENRIRRWSGIGLATLPMALIAIVVVLNALNNHINKPEMLAVLSRITLIMFVWALIALGAVNGFLAASFRFVTRWQYKEAFSMPSFFATLPMSTGDFVWVKLTSVTMRMLAFSAIAVIACAWIAFSMGFVDDARVQDLALAVLAFVLVLLGTTASLMSLSLGGGAWNRSNAIHFSRYLIFAIGGSWVGAYWGTHHAPPPALPEIVRGLAILKLVTLVLLMRHVGLRGFLSWTRLATLLAFWLATFGSLLATGLAFLPEGAISTPTLAAACVLLSPVQGTVAAPLSLHLNRVR